MTVDYKPIANTDPGANVVTQVEYEALLGGGGALEDGYESGTAKSAEMNKTLRQSSMVASAVATAISELLGVDVLDDGDLPALTALLKAAMTASGFSTGDGKITLKTVADTGWIMANDGTIGSATSGATTRANADTEPLYTLLWNNVSQTYATVATGRGANAAADFAANKTITLTRTLGRAIAIAGAGSGLTARALGEFLGQESVALTLANNGPHTHNSRIVDAGFGGAVPTTALSSNVGGSFGLTTDSSGSGTPHENMPPESFWNAMIKL